ncbi:fungal specific transcription factor domain containing protein [Sporothrix brasiliensis 5110]|uniref:Fungal specific transcription factor domain containing protein n=1 Tax=Sporothrix brasiliensis 5110 TaxID=1398154 RepID=A0A0C2IWA1_9PEZI|nr:fungal specific transcription factor domain containing protein [Sporothrix brasiliensis 5110]KIH89267.1 fungal specific transcription factor domain containing protein [Sporothrix brasiliensis 5110]
MAVALELHREMDANASVTPVEREMRRRLFWTCYLLDRFMACGSKRPSLIHDSTIFLRLPSWLNSSTSMPVNGDFFQTASNLQYLQNGAGKRLQGGSGMLIDISRILGITNRYLAAGGVKGDSHFPWHSLSNLSKIRQDLDLWATGAQDIFSSVETLFSQPDATVLVMSKLIYHLIHCLIYRPFLPVDLAELSGTGQHQSWQIEATNMCFLHANAIAELTELGRQMPQIEWPGFVGYCICTAGTVHIHGAHYNKNAAGNEMGIFATSAEFLSREMQHMAEMRHAWACVEHHRQTLQSIYSAHTELVKNVSNSPMRYSPVFQLEDFFDRYLNIGGPGGSSFNFDASNLILADVLVDFKPDSYAGHNLYTTKVDYRDPSGDTCNSANCASSANNGGANSASGDSAMDVVIPERPSLKRRKTVPAIALPGGPGANNPVGGMQTPRSTQTPVLQRGPYSAAPFSTHNNPGLLTSPSSMARSIPHPTGSIDDQMLGNDKQSNMGDMPGLSFGSQMGLHGQPQEQQQHPMQQQQHQPLPSSGTPFSPGFTFSTLAGNVAVPGSGSATLPGAHRDMGHAGMVQGDGQVALSGYDPMFTTMPTNSFASPSPWIADQSSGAGKPTPGVALQNSPDGRSNDGSTGGTAAGDEKDPFLSLLEQLAENEYARGPGNELDFFLASNAGSV